MSTPRFGPGFPNFDEIMLLHDAAVRDGLAFYRDPRTGLSVMTGWFLRKRGYCCESGCRHCPYGRDNLH